MNCAHCRSPIEWDSKRNVALDAGLDRWQVHRCLPLASSLVNECICGGLVVVVVGAEGTPKLDWPDLTLHSHAGLPTLAQVVQKAEKKPPGPAQRPTPPPKTPLRRVPERLGMPE